MANRRGDNGNSDRLYFPGLQNHSDGDCSHKIKRHLLFGRKAMTNLDSILKSTDITLLTKVHLVTSVQFSRSAVSDSLQPHEPQHTRPPCPSPTPGVYPSSCPLSRGTIQPSHPLSSPSLPALVFPSIRVFSNESALCIRGPKYWSFSFNISPSNECSGLISFRIDWLDLLCSPRDSQESSPTPQFKSISFLYSPALISIHDYWKNHSLD